ncbi:MAG TPA: hypothetical protein VI229_00345 [Burkholderiales bacterium]
MNAALALAHLALERARVALAKLQGRWPAGTPGGRGGEFAPRGSGTPIPAPPEFLTSNAAVKAQNEQLAAQLHALALAGNVDGLKAWTQGLDKSSKLAAYRAKLLAALGAAPAHHSKPAVQALASHQTYDTTGDGWTHATDLKSATAALAALGVNVLPASKQPGGPQYDDAGFLRLMNQTGREISRLNQRWPGIGSVLNLSRTVPKGGAYGVCYKDALYEQGPPVTLALKVGISTFKNKAGRPFGVQGYVGEHPQERFASVMRHELGHSLDYMTGKANRDALKATHFEVDGKPADTATWAQRNLSEYSKTNTSEALAEMFAHYASPGYGKGASPKLPGDVEAIMEKLAKRVKK